MDIENTRHNLHENVDYFYILKLKTKTCKKTKQVNIFKLF